MHWGRRGRRALFSLSYVTIWQCVSDLCPCVGASSERVRIYIDVRLYIFVCTRGKREEGSLSLPPTLKGLSTHGQRVLTHCHKLTYGAYVADFRVLLSSFGALHVSSGFL